MSNPKDYAVGWICAISTEYVAAQAFLDEKHEGPEYVSPNDNNDYTLGRIGKHNVVIAVLPDGEYGTSSATGVAKDMLHSFPNIRIGLMVGIGGGAPSPKHDIRLGDIVVSTPRDGKGGVLQYDFGKTIQDHDFQITGYLNQPPTVLRTAVNGLKAQYESEGHQIEDAVTKILETKPRLQKKYKRPSSSSDQLYQAKFVHPINKPSCTGICDKHPANQIPRCERGDDGDNPTIHYGLIASGNELMKDALIRNKLAEKHGVLCFEMEAAGLMNQFPCLVVRGICDYSDSHTTKDWQGYAAMAAAAYTKDLLYRIPPNRTEAEKRISDILTDIQDVVHDFRRVQRDQEVETILTWLTPIEYAPIQNDNIRRRQSGTGQWFLDSAEFQAYLDAPKQTMFCPGIPGAGKTILTSIVIDELYKRYHADPSVGIAFIYCNFRRQGEQQIDNLLASLVKQLLRGLPALPSSIKDLYGQNRVRQTRPSLGELSAALHSVGATYSRIFIVVDALDECQISDGCRSKLLSEIFQLQARTGANFFATSRPILHVEKDFKDRECISLEILASDEDVHRYLDGHMSEFPRFISKRLDLQEEIKVEISRAVQGMFLLAQLYLDELQDKTSAREIKSTLEEFRKQNQYASSEDQKLSALAQAYKYAMERINGQKPGFQSLALKVLAWITCAKRPITTSELRHALAVKIGDSELDKENLREIEDIVAVCAGLVTVDEESNIIRLVHYTTQEYFERTQTTWFPDAQRDIARTCITYLSFDVFETCVCKSWELRERLEQNSFYDYAARYWGDHARVSSTLENQLILNFLRSGVKMSGSCQVTLGLEVIESKIIEIHVAAYFGLKEAIIALAGTGCYPNLDNKTGSTPLFSAAQNGHEAVVRLLIEMGANLEPRDNSGQTPLLSAALRGHEAVVKLLVEKGADIEAKDEDGSTSLMRAAIVGQETMVKLLVENGADIEAKDEDGWTSLMRAALFGQETIVKLLVENGADIEAKDEAGSTSLLWAVENGHEAVAKLLVEKGADMEAREGGGRTSLWWAVYYGREAAVKLLVENGADIEAKDEDGWTLLGRAMLYGHEAVMKLLVEKGADVEAKDESGLTLLMWAVCYGHEAVVKLLVEKGADIEAKDRNGWTPLCWAAQQGKEKMVSLLLEKGAIIESKNVFDQTPAFLAASEGHVEVVSLLQRYRNLPSLPISANSFSVVTWLSSFLSRSR